MLKVSDVLGTFAPRPPLPLHLPLRNLNSDKTSRVSAIVKLAPVERKERTGTRSDISKLQMTYRESIARSGAPSRIEGAEFLLIPLARGNELSTNQT